MIVLTTQTLSISLIPFLSLLALIILIIRTCWVLISLRKHQQLSDDDGTIVMMSSSKSSGNPPPPTTTRRRRSKPIKTLVVLGSGGHTTEMLHLLKNINPNMYTPLIYVVATTDSTSLRRLKAFQEEGRGRLQQNQHQHQQQQVYRIPRSREVGQSYVSSVWTTLYSLIHAVFLVLRVRPGLVFTNGPGTCLPIVVVTLLCRIIGICEGRNVFVESFCRVKSLSLTGRILYNIVDLFVVHWEELHHKFPRSKIISTFVPPSTKPKNT